MAKGIVEVPKTFVEPQIVSTELDLIEFLLLEEVAHLQLEEVAHVEQGLLVLLQIRAQLRIVVTVVASEALSDPML